MSTILLTLSAALLLSASLALGLLAKRRLLRPARR